MEVEFSWILQAGEVINLAHWRGGEQVVSLRSFGDVSTNKGEAFFMVNGETRSLKMPR